MLIKLSLRQISVKFYQLLPSPNILIILSFCLTISYLLLPYWQQDLIILHMGIESIPFFLSIVIYLIIWQVYEKTAAIFRLIGHGFFIISLLLFFHIAYILTFNTIDHNISFAYSFLRSIFESLIIFYISISIKKFNYNKIVGFFISLVFSLVLVFSIIYLHLDYLITLIHYNKVLNFIYYFFIFLVILISIKNIKRHQKENNTYNYIFISGVFFLLTRLSYLFSANQWSFTYLLGRISYLVYYICFFKAITVTAINEPYIKLEENNLQMNDILDFSPHGLIKLDNNNIVNFVSKTAENILKINKKDIIGKTLHNLIEKFCLDNQDISTIVNNFNIGFTRGYYENVRTLKTNNNNEIILHIKFHKVKNGIVVLFSEVSNEQKLENLQLQTQAVLNSSQNAVIITDKNNKIINYNSMFEKITGIELQNFKNKTLKDLYKVLKLKAKKKIYKNQQFEASIITSTGIKKEVIINYSPIKNIKNQLIGYILMASDITPLKKEHEKLLQQEKLALMGQLGASIVHETKNYLSIIKGSSQFLKLIAKEQRVLQMANKIDIATDEVNRIIIGFLNMARPKVAELKQLYINPVIISMEHMLQTSSWIKGVEISIELSEKEKSILSDESQLKQVILNIVKNGIEAMKNTKNPYLKITTSLDTREKNMIIAIKDNGKGIPAELKEKIGTPFFSTKNSGTGLGLNVCYQIIKEHNGNIDFESELNKGTTFIISLPVIK